jgi:hypothetical protein
MTEKNKPGGKSKKKKILFILNFFEGGGIERVVLTLADHFYKKNVEVHVIIVGKFKKNDYDIPDYIKIYHPTPGHKINSIPIIRFSYKLYQAYKLSFLLKSLHKKYGRFDLILRYVRAPMPRFIFRNFIENNNIFTWIHQDDSFIRKSYYRKKLHLKQLVTDKICIVSNGLRKFLKEFDTKNKEIKIDPSIFERFDADKIADEYLKLIK